MLKRLLTFLGTKPNTLRVQVPHNHILIPNLYYNYYYPKPKYLTIEYMDPSGIQNMTGIGAFSIPIPQGTNGPMYVFFILKVFPYSITLRIMFFGNFVLIADQKRLQYRHGASENVEACGGSGA